MKKYSIKIIQILSVGLFAATLVFSQPTESAKDVFFRVNVEGDYGRMISDLKKENFTLKEEGIEQEITSFAVDDSPASVVILMDVSYSIELEVRQAMTRAALKFIQNSDSKNEYSIIAFGDVNLQLTDWASTDEELLDALNKIANFNGKIKETDFFGACLSAMEKLNTGKNQKKVLLIFSDGEDNANNKKYKEVTNLSKTLTLRFFHLPRIKRMVFRVNPGLLCYSQDRKTSLKSPNFRAEEVIFRSSEKNLTKLSNALRAW